ncbi:MAG TPA: calcium-binding protein [Solirubrobacterales bacterium]|nr:calcium-binding protein [Solirubrobacterales bacterium]
MLPRVSRPLAFLFVLVGCLLVAPVSASAAVTGEGFEAEVVLTSDGSGDVIELTCAAGMAPGGFVTQVPCADVQTVIVRGNGGDDEVKLENVGTTDFPALSRVEINGGEGEDKIFGTQIGDTVVADEEDVVSTGAGDDFIEGGDAVSAGEGDDEMLLSQGNANGGFGDDRFKNPQNLPFGQLTGGPGTDTFELDFPAPGTINARFDVENGGLGISSGMSAAAFAWTSIDRVDLSLTDFGTQTVDASKFSGTLEADGRGGPDVLIGSPGEDLLSGGPGNDEITGGPGFDWVKGGTGADQLQLRDGAVDRGVCGDDADTAIADQADSLDGCESIDLPSTPAATTPTAVVPITAVRDTLAPSTSHLKGPKKVIQGKLAVFTFTSSESGGTFKCRVDKGSFKSCKSPLKAKTGALDPSKKHTISVFAIDAAGNADATPATFKFSVEEKPRPAGRG